MQVKHVIPKQPQIALLIATIVALVAAFYPLLTFAVHVASSWLATGHAIIIACFTHGC